MEFKVPSRGLIGLRNEMLTETRGTIVMNSIAGDYIPYQGEIPQRPSGALISDRSGNDDDVCDGRRAGARCVLHRRRR